jgi:hypothetical protein
MVKILKDDKGKDQVETKITKTIDSNTKWTLAFWVFIQVVFVTMVYGPIAAFLVEMFPIRIRYTSMSLPYHIGNGIFGGLLPAVATYLSKPPKANAIPEKAGQTITHQKWYLEELVSYCCSSSLSNNWFNLLERKRQKRRRLMMRCWMIDGGC